MLPLLNEADHYFLNMRKPEGTSSIVLLALQRHQDQTGAKHYTGTLKFLLTVLQNNF